MQDLLFLMRVYFTWTTPMRMVQRIRRSVLLHGGHASLALLLLVGVVGVLPGGSRPVQTLLHQFGVGIPWFGQPVGITQEIPGIPVAEAQKQVSFTLRLPTWLPAGLTVGGAHVSPGGTWANTFYLPRDAVQQANHAGMGIGVSPQPMLPPSEHGPNALVNGHPATYDTIPTYSVLSWEQDGLYYSLSASHLDLTQEDMIRIAESLR